MEPRFDRDQLIVLITDGEDHESAPLDAARRAAERNVRIVAIGLGDPVDGARIPARDRAGNLSYLRHAGREVRSTLDEGLLRELAATTSGGYVPARTRVYDLGAIYEDHLASLSRADMETVQRRRYYERFQIFAALALVCLVCESLIPATGRTRRVENAEIFAR